MAIEARTAIKHSRRAMGAASRRFAGRSLAVALLLLAFFGPRPAAASEYDERRARAAVKLFRALLAADLGLEKKVQGDGTLLVLFLADDAARAKDLEAAFAGDATEAEGIRGIPLVVETTADPTFARYRDRPPAGIFLAAEPGAARLRDIVSYGIEHGVIVYSPFEGHVEAGVLAGLSIEAQVRPYLNAATLQASSISLKSFFLKVTKLYP